MKKNIKIAIISPIPEESAKMCRKLSKSFDLPYIGKESPDSALRIIYNNGEKRKYSSNEIYTAILSQFHTRIKKEKTPRFISDGTVLNGFVSKRVEIWKKRILKRTFLYRILESKFHEFEKKIEKLIEDYAQTAYDKIYFLKGTDITRNESVSLFENFMLEILNRKNIKYAVINGDFDASLGDISDDLNKLFFIEK